MLGDTLQACYTLVILHIEIKIQTPRDPLVKRYSLPTQHFPFSLSVRTPASLWGVMCPVSWTYIPSCNAGEVAGSEMQAEPLGGASREALKRCPFALSSFFSCPGPRNSG